MCVDAVTRGDVVSYEMKALNQLGWMSIGFGSSMNNNTSVVVMWPNSDGSVTLSQRLAAGHVEPRLDPQPSRVATVSTHMDISSDTSPILAFDVPNDGSTVAELIWAFGVTPPNSTDPSAHIEQHLDAGSFTLDLSKDTSGDDDDDDQGSSSPAPTSSMSATSSSLPLSVSSTPTDSPTSSHSSTSSSASSSSGSASASAVPALSSPGGQSHQTILVAHTVLSFLGFAVILPLAAVIARWGRTLSNNWFRAHWLVVAMLGLPTMLPGWILGPVLVSRQRHKHIVNEHQIVGVIILALCIVQMSVGTFVRLRGPPTRSGKAHPVRNILHVVLGLAIIGLSLSEVFTGVARTMTFSSNTKRLFTVGCIIWTSAVAATYASGLLRLRRQLAQERLGWHLPLPTPPRAPSPPLGVFAAPQPLRSGSPGRPARAREGEDDELGDVFRHLSSGGPTSTGRAHALSVVEMRELQGPLPISVRY
ncbi:CBD9-like protein [Phanerochaete sordida]|uniref:CBD9-like protein n=1 Tax=Phanerochaete sordida TaxID=48140 RepID=A0A9P3GKT2_9APHY|nr:CBD9-like protein [Phanerochaete sordida]